LTLNQLLLLLLPELMMAVGALAILGLDLAWPGDGGRRRWLPWVAFLLLLVLVATIVVWPLAGANGVPLTFATGQDFGGDQVPMLAVDGLALFFKLFTVLVLALVALASAEYVQARITSRGEFYALLLFAGLAMMLATASTNLLVKYFVYGATASAIMLYGFSLFYGATGTIDLAGIASALATGSVAVRWLVYPATIMTLVGLGFKIALVPFHQWAPDAYEGAPTPVTAFLSVGPKAVGFGVLIRFLLTALPDFQVDWMALLAGMAIVTMFLGNLVALWQTNVKRMLAYSSIAQAGYMLIGLAALAPQAQSWTTGLNGLLLYLFAYLFANLGAFAVVIAVENRTGSAELPAFAGLMRRCPWLAIAMFIFLLSLIGIPPTGGFMGKLFVFGAAIQRQMILLAVVGIINSVISVYYYYTIMREMFFTEGDAEPMAIGLPLQLAVAITAVVVLVIGLYAEPFIQLATQSVNMLAVKF
jgi:NADH:ubiquinone oxidoreductase subunit 2 (subunit N)